MPNGRRHGPALAGLAALLAAALLWAGAAPPAGALDAPTPAPASATAQPATATPTPAATAPTSAPTATPTPSAPAPTASPPAPTGTPSATVPPGTATPPTTGTPTPTATPTATLVPGTPTATPTATLVRGTPTATPTATPQVGSATPTPTPTASGSTPAPTPTSPGGTATPTPTSATATPTPAPPSATATPTAGQPKQRPAPQQRFRLGEILVRYTDTVAATMAGTRTYAGVHRVPVPPGQEEAWATLLARDPRVVYAEPDYLVQRKDLRAAGPAARSAFVGDGRTPDSRWADARPAPTILSHTSTAGRAAIAPPPSPSARAERGMGNEVRQLPRLADAARIGRGSVRAQAAPSPVPIDLGQTVSGALTSADARSPQRGSSYYADRYRFGATAGQRVVIAAWSTAFDAYLYLFRPDGSLLASNDDGGGGTNARIPATSGMLSLPETGTYVIEVTSYWPNETGPYTLELGTETSTVPNDPSYAASQGNLRTMRLPEAWAITTGSSAITIAVVDTGVDLAHPDLASKIAPGGWDFVNNDDSPQDDEGHGTHVAGIAAAATNNGVGIAGVAWQARILPVKVLDSSGSGFNSDVASGIRWAADRGAQIINLSLGAPFPSQVVQDAIAYARGRGALVVAAGGNCGPPSPSASCGQINEPDYPAAYPSVVAVAATDQSDQRASFSTVQSYIDLAAPGASIFSTYWDFGSTYASLSGTSMAAPHVAGLAALILALLPQLSADEVTQVMEDTADKVGSSAYVGGRNDEYGHGRVNALAALQYTQRTGVSGTATRSDSGAALAGATVRISGRTTATTSTDASGRFTATLPPGSYQVCLSAPNFAETCRSTTVDLGTRSDLGTIALAVLSSTPPSASLAFAAQPVRAANGYDLGVQPSIVLRDTTGMTLTADSTTVVTLAIQAGSGASGAVLTCDQTVGGVTTLRVTAGLATFTGCAIDRPGAGYVLEARAAGAAPAATLPFNVTWAGDASGDGRVSIVDYSLDVTCFNAAPADARWLDAALRCWRADLNGDQVVDVVDHSIVVTHFGTSTLAAVAPSGPAP